MKEQPKRTTTKTNKETGGAINAVYYILAQFAALPNARTSGECF